MKRIILLALILFLEFALMAEKTGGGYFIITKKGDTLWRIANKHYGFASNTIYQAIKAANEDVIKSINYIRPGSKIYLPTKEEINKFSLLLMEEAKRKKEKAKNVVTKEVVKKVSSQGSNDLIKNVIKSRSSKSEGILLPKSSVSSPKRKKVVLPKKPVSGR